MIFASLISGLVGVVVGAIFQYFHAVRFEREKTVNEFIKIFCTEWLKLLDQTQDLVNNPTGYNHMIFNQYCEDKANLIEYIKPLTRSEAKRTSLSGIQDMIRDRIDFFSLQEDFEAVLNLGEGTTEKQRFFVTLNIFINDVHSSIAKCFAV